MTNFIKKHSPEIILTITILCLHVPVIFAHENQLLPWFNTDDAYYYFKTAQNIASGNGVTFDGIAVTNGFHPLWMLILIPVFSLANIDLVLPLRILAGILMLLNIGSALLVYELLRRYLSKEIAFITAAGLSLLPSFHDWTTKNGLETGLVVFCVLLLLHQRDKAEQHIWRFGFLAALAALARLDNVFFTGFMGAWVAFQAFFNYQESSVHGRWNKLAGSIGSRNAYMVRLIVGYFLPLTLAILLFMAWSQFTVGTPTPVSGQVKRWWGTLPNSIYGFPPKQLINFIGQFFTDDRSIGPWSIITAPLYGAAESILPVFGMQVTTNLRRITLMLIALTGTSVIGVTVYKNWQFIWKTIQKTGLIPLFLGCLAQITYYKAFGSVAQREWYWMTENLFILLLGAVLLQSFINLLRKLTVFQGRFFSKHLPAAAPAIILLLLVWPHLPRTQAIILRELPDQDSFYLRRARWVEAHTEAGSLIGMTGTGSSGYFTNDRVLVNLDGLISSYTYLQHMKAGTAAQYLSDIGLNYVFGNEYIITMSDPYSDIFENHLAVDAVFEDEGKVLVLWRFIP